MDRTAPKRIQAEATATVAIIKMYRLGDLDRVRRVSDEQLFAWLEALGYQWNGTVWVKPGGNSGAFV